MICCFALNLSIRANHRGSLTALQQVALVCNLIRGKKRGEKRGFYQELEGMDTLC